VRSRVAVADELRGGFGKLSDRAADEADREALLARQREVEAQVAKLAEETSRATTQVTEEVREAVAKLGDIKWEPAARKLAAERFQRGAFQISLSVESTETGRGLVLDAAALLIIGVVLDFLGGDQPVALRHVLKLQLPHRQDP